MIRPSRIMTSLLVLYAGICASAEPSTAGLSVPDKLKPGASESLKIVALAKGVQIYECRASTAQQPGTYEWTLVAPEAELFDARGNRIGRHYGGPRWESTDGSTILGSVKERADAPAADAIPWVLLAAKSVGTEGSFSKVTSVLRVNTVGGVAPRSGCSQATAGASVRVDYTADYYLFDGKAESQPSPYATGF
jgi:hypothetical protein